MKQILALALLVLALTALETGLTHEQAKPAAPAATTTTTTSTTTTPTATATQPAATPKPATNITPPAPAPKVVVRQPHKEPGFEATPGNPFGRDPQGHKTCKQNPCYDPVGACTIVVKAPVQAKASTKAVVSPTAGKTSTTTTTTTQASAAVQTKQGTWKPIIYVVRVNGRRARFTGFRCA